MYEYIWHNDSHHSPKLALLTVTDRGCLNSFEGPMGINFQEQLSKNQIRNAAKKCETLKRYMHNIFYLKHQRFYCIQYTV